MNLQFKKIESDDIEIMMPFYQMRKNRTCDSVFLESFIWKEFYNVQYAVWENKAILWLMEYGGKSFSAMPLCREEDLPEAFKALETYFNEELGVPLVINLADEYAVEYLNLSETEYLVDEQVDSKDYIYAGDAMRTLAGKKLHKKKNHLNFFVRNYGEQAEYRALCCSDSHVVWEFLDKWHEAKGDGAEEHLDYEIKGIHDILKNCSNLNIRMGGVYIDDKLEAFTIGSYNPIEDMAVIHIEKANPEIRGLYQYINQQFLLAEFPEVAWVNREDDLGLEGLRKAKMSYEPIDFARKYLVQQKLEGKHDYTWAEEIGNTMSGESVSYLTGIAEADTVSLWRECFPEDSENFIDYYYSEKTTDNHLLVKKINGFMIAMVHLNPYQMHVKQNVLDVAYIVGVATEPNHRHQGHMGDLLKRMAEDMAADRTPFAFLMPVAKEIYLPFMFEYICDQPVFRLKEEAAFSLKRITCETAEDCQAVSEYMEKWLAKRYEVYCQRDEAYVSRLLKELKSENGQLDFLYDGEKLVGLSALWGIENKEQRLLYAEPEYTEFLLKKPAIMARIICLESFLPEFSLKTGNKGEKLLLSVRDPLLQNNNRSFIWSFTEETTVLEPLKETEHREALQTLPTLDTGIQELTSWLFGYKKPEELWPSLTSQTRELLAKIEVINGVFIDEVV